MRVLLLFFVSSICACNNNSKSTSHVNNDTSKIGVTSIEKNITKRPYSSFNEFRNSIRCNSLSFIPVKITNSIIKRVGKDTTILYFNYSGIQFKYTSILRMQDGDDSCDSLFSYYFTVNDQIIQAKSIPDSLRNHGFDFDKICGLTLDLGNSAKIELNGATYLLIPSSTDVCIGAFCHNEIDHLFEIKDNKVTYLTVDGWQICDVNNDNQIEQIVFNDDPIEQYHFLNKLKKEKATDTTNVSVTNSANIQIWTFKNNEWKPLRDNDGKPFFIFLGFDHMYKPDTYRVLDYNWINKL
jgi:hypothetical protein